MLEGEAKSGHFSKRDEKRTQRKARATYAHNLLFLAVSYEHQIIICTAFHACYKYEYMLFAINFVLDQMPGLPCL